MTYDWRMSNRSSVHGEGGLYKHCNLDGDTKIRFNVQCEDGRSGMERRLRQIQSSSSRQRNTIQRSGIIFDATILIVEIWHAPRHVLGHRINDYLVFPPFHDHISALHTRKKDVIYTPTYLIHTKTYMFGFSNSGICMLFICCFCQVACVVCLLSCLNLDKFPSSHALPDISFPCPFLMFLPG